MIHHGYTVSTKFHTPSSYISFVIYFKTRPKDIYLKAFTILFHIIRKSLLNTFACKGKGKSSPYTGY